MLVAARVHWRHGPIIVPASDPPPATISATRTLVRILVDGDACPVKEQVYRVAARYDVPVLVVANSQMRIPDQAGVELKLVPGGLDAVDDWIAEAATDRDIVATADILLAGRVVDRGAICIDFRGKEYTADALGGMLATREVAQYLRGYGAYGGGPPPLNPRDRGRFAGKLDEVVNRRLRAARQAGSS
jgi:uncharacterized protein YaiI (UPF0178 family)